LRLFVVSRPFPVRSRGPTDVRAVLKRNIGEEVKSTTVDFGPATGGGLLLL